jgi:hypothetical protein
LKTSTVDLVREQLLQYKDRHRLTNRCLSRIVFRPNGDNYSHLTIKHFLADDKPEADWSRLVVAVIDSIPTVASGVAVARAKKVPR